MLNLLLKQDNTNHAWLKAMELEYNVLIANNPWTITNLLLG